MSPNSGMPSPPSWEQRLAGGVCSPVWPGASALTTPCPTQHPARFTLLQPTWPRSQWLCLQAADPARSPQRGQEQTANKTYEPSNTLNKPEGAQLSQVHLFTI